MIGTEPDRHGTIEWSLLCRKTGRQLLPCGCFAPRSINTSNDNPPLAQLTGGVGTLAARVEEHLKKLGAVIEAAKDKKPKFTHGIAAKLITCYLKARGFSVSAELYTSFLGLLLSSQNG